MKIEEFMKERKKRDNIDEFDVSKKIDNIHQFINYVFEYFNLYIDIDEIEKEKIELNEKALKYKKELSDYSVETQEWLLKIFMEENIKFVRTLRNRLQEDIAFGLYYDSKGWQKASFNLYAKLIKKYPFLDRYIDELNRFTVDESNRTNVNYLDQLSNEAKGMLPEKVKDWVCKTGRKYHVDLMEWAFGYAEYFSDNSEAWPISRRIKGEYIDTYNVKPKANRFDIDGLYNQLGDIEYIRGKKKYLEVIIMFVWLDTIDFEFKDFYEEFLKEKGF